MPLLRLRAALAVVLIAACATTTHAQARWKLTETLRLGGAESGPESFVYVKAIEADARGRILVYDRSTKDIRMFAPDGQLIRVIGRLGSGPGEMRDAEGIVIARNGRIWVRDAANARFTVFSAEGEYEKSWTMKFCTSQGAWDPRPDGRSRLVDSDCIVSGGRALKSVIVAYHTDMSRVDTLADVPECGTRELNEAGTWITRTARGTSYRTIPYAAGSHGAVGPSGEAWCVPNSARYEILRIGAGAKDTTRIARQVALVPVTPAERDSVIAQIEERGPTGLDFGRIPKTKPAIDRLTIDDQGRLWVRRMNARGGIEFDIYDPSGRLVATAGLGVFKVSIWTPFVVRGDHVYTVVFDEDDVQRVARFRITR